MKNVAPSPRLVYSIYRLEEREWLLGVSVVSVVSVVSGVVKVGNDPWNRCNHMQTLFVLALFAL